MSTTAACPDKECNEPVDVIIRSSDGKLFGAHSHRLALYSTAFPSGDAGGDAPVTEQGDVIELLLRYFHPEHEFPDTMSIRFELFDRLAEAAEKYTVHSLIQISKLRMRLSVPTYPLEVLRYAVKRDYLMLWEPAATQSLASCSSREALRVFGEGRLYSAWTSYREQYADVYTWVTSERPEPNQHSGGSRKCKIWDRYVKDIQREANRCIQSGELTNVNSFEGTMHIMGEGRFNDCSCNDAAISRWWNRVRLSDPKDFRYFY